MRGGPQRTLRVALFAALATALAMAAHAIGTGCAPSQGASAVALLLAWSTACLLPNRRHGVLVTTAWLLGLQVVLHLTFAVASGTWLSGGAAMLLGHVLATLLSGWILAHGLEALTTVDAALGRALLRRLACPALRFPFSVLPTLPSLGWTAPRTPAIAILWVRGPPLAR